MLGDKKMKILELYRNSSKFFCKLQKPTPPEASK